MTDADTTPRTGPAGDTPPPPPPQPHRRLVRRRDDRMVAGVASGIAAYLGIDPAIVRILFVVLAFAGASGLVAYLACWLLLPEGQTDEAAAAPRVVASGAPFWVGVGLLALAALILADQSWFIGRGVGVPLVLVALGVALWKVSQDRQTGAVAAPPPPSTPPTGDTPADAQETLAMQTTTGSTPAAWTPPPVPGQGGPRPADPTRSWTPPPVPPREHSFLGRLTIAMVFIVLGTAMTLDQLDLVELTAAAGSALALLVVGIGLVVGAWFGRARWLGLVGLALVPVVLVTSLASSLDVSLGGGIGERSYEATTAASLAPVYRLGAGELTLDLRDLQTEPGRTASTEVRVGAGEVRIVVPDDLTVALDIRVQVGEIDLPGRSVDGTDLRREVVLGDADGPVDLRLDVTVGAGQVTVTRATPDRPASTPTEEFTR